MKKTYHSISFLDPSTVHCKWTTEDNEIGTQPTMKFRSQPFEYSRNVWQYNYAKVVNDW